MSPSLIRALQYTFSSPSQWAPRSEKQAQQDPRQSVSGAGAHASTTGSVAQALADFGLRSRRSTGASGAEAASSSQGGAATSGAGAGAVDGGATTKRRSHKLSRMSTSGVGSQGVSSADHASFAEAAAYPGPHPASTAAAAGAATAAAAPAAHTANGKAKRTPQPTAPDDRFSTADRAILEELKAGIRAREAQFTLKGVGHTVLGGGRGAGKKHHAYALEEVPYPRSYGREVIDLDVWETLFVMDACKSLSWHIFDIPPVKVLEIGCGTGTWVLHCARVWKETHFVGLDIVPLHPDLQTVGSPDLASRITWVQHNFLDGLPFQNEEFDFVHAKRIALGVPEDKWDPFFEEVARVLKPGGRLEMIEEDLFFPGKIDHDDDDRSYYGRDDTSSIMTRQDSVRTSLSINGHERDRETQRLEDVSENAEPTGHAEKEQDAPPTPKTRSAALPRVNGSASRPSSPVRSTGGGSVNGHRIGGSSSFDANDPHGALLKPTGLSSSLSASSQGSVPPHSRSAARPTGGRSRQLQHPPAPSLSSSLSASSQGSVLPHSRSVARPALQVRMPAKETHVELMYGSSASLLGSMGYLAYQDPFAEALRRQRKIEAALKKNQAPLQGSQKTRPSPFLSTLMNKGPVNPRDHTLLEAVWEGMLEGRFVNGSPLSLLTTYMEYHFKDVRTHPPIIFTFPPVPPEAPKSDDGVEEARPFKLRVPVSESDTDDAHDYAGQRPKIRSTRSDQPTTSDSESGEAPAEDTRLLSVQGLRDNKSPYISFDGLRTYAYSPSKQATSKKAANAAAAESMNMLTVTMVTPSPADSGIPNKQLNINLNTLNMHLTLRAKEIVACSESMWEWVESVQTAAAAQLQADTADGGQDASRAVILDMTREDFDRMLVNFEWDMLDKASLGNALQEKFHWNTFEGTLLLDRKAYDQACEKYDEWAEKEHRLKLEAATEHYSHAQHHSRNSMSTPGLVPPPSDAIDVSQIARSQSSPQPSSSPSLPPNVADDAHATSRRVPESSANLHFGEAASNVSSTQVPPTQMQSRSMRVFLARKTA